MLAHAGGSSAEFSGWDHPACSVDFVAVQLPGRGARFSEPPIANVKEMAEEIASAISDDLPYGFFGHSFGALLAYEVCCAVRARGMRMPRWLGVSAFPPPDAIPAAPALHTLPGLELLHELSRRFDAIPREFLEDEELGEIVVEYVRADYQALETYIFDQKQPLALAIDVMAPVDDYHLPPLLGGWGRHTHGDCRISEFSGGHFYLRSRENRERLCGIIATGLLNGDAA
ncbi:thioesterase II family protein [Streptomyces goshikiensis]|uniref:thioesterase II family protein n=1 Tax=Streptomyces goshikiensis TaxID=1942 RepID=UPI0036F5A335